jgi:hypothetical protein
MPIDEEPDCEPSKKDQAKNSPGAHRLCLAHFRHKEWETSLCQFLGMSIPALAKLAAEMRVCA